MRIFGLTELALETMSGSEDHTVVDNLTAKWY